MSPWPPPNPALLSGLCLWWQRLRGRPPASADLNAVEHWRVQAEQRFQGYGSAEDLLAQRGYRLVMTQQSPLFAGLRWRARLDMESSTLTVYAASLDELQDRLPDRQRLCQVVIDHEIFHLLCPDCPHRLQEACAHLFTACRNGLEEFPGVWDLSRE